MTDPKPIASLSPTLLARKGGAKPAMRSQMQALSTMQVATAHDIEDELGWNDMGEDHPAAPEMAEVVVLNPEMPVEASAVPEVVQLRASLPHRVAETAAQRRSALAYGGRAAFTLRLDADRHLKLRLASTLSNRSAQNIVQEALDRLIAEMPDVSALAAQVKKRR